LMSETRVDRREFVRGALAAGGAAALSLEATPAPAGEGPASASTRPGKRKALFVYGGWEGHTPSKSRDLFVPWLERTGFEVLASDTQEPYADAALMKTVDLVVQTWTIGTIKKEQLQGLLAAVKEGAGLAGWHGGLADAYRQEAEYQYMVGGSWVAHPGNQIDYEVRIVDSEDPVTAGLRDFRVHDEQYFMHVNPNNKVLATTAFTGAHHPWIDGCTMPVVWKKVYGKGRVFYSSLGHTVGVFDTPEALEIVRRGLLWASESRYTPTPELVSPVYPLR
ncbi:MAG TPA: ThuA domain-containing protein, partial [Vicinamibacteria bacterium]|nr:ThuA domain-containing protein [Vicinamibacteria bacterium]